ncbi:MAG: PKD domain-containing protein, partial [Rubripirellula sp.]
THTATINWGDGTTESGTVGSGTVTGSHVYTDDGVYTVTVTVTDDDNGSHSDTFTVTVANAVPVVEAGADQSADEGSSISLDPCTLTDAGSADTHTATINWGDGTTESGVVGSGTVAGTHTYLENGTYTVTVTVTDSDSDSGSDTLTVTINNVVPTIDSATIPGTGTEDVAVSFAVSASDPAGVNDPITYAWDFGDGNTGSGATPSHTYAEEGTYNVSVTASDDDGGVSLAFSDDIEIAAVDETAPSATVGVLPVFTPAANIPLTLDIALDDSGPAGEPSSGVATYDVYVAMNNDPYTLFADDVPASQTQVQYLAAMSQTRYWFRAVATDAAGNEEENVIVAEANTFTGDLEAPVSSVTGATASTEGMIQVDFTATDQGGSGVGQVELFVSIDGTAGVPLISSPVTINGDDAATHTGSLHFQAIRDGAEHTNFFY